MPPQLAAVLRSVDGWKTYGCSIVLVLLAVLDLSGLVPAEQRTAVYAAVTAALAASLRHAITKLPPETLAKIVRLKDLLDAIGDHFPPAPPPSPSPPAAAPGPIGVFKG